MKQNEILNIFCKTHETYENFGLSNLNDIILATYIAENISVSCPKNKSMLLYDAVIKFTASIL